MDANFFGKAVDIPSGGILPTGRRVRCLGMRRLSSPQLTASAKTWASRRPSSGNPFRPTWHSRPTRPSLITETRETYIDVDIDHGVQYGYTLAWEPGQHEPPGVGKAIVHLDVDRFYDLYAS